MLLFPSKVVDKKYQKIKLERGYCRDQEYRTDDWSSEDINVISAWKKAKIGISKVWCSHLLFFSNLDAVLFNCNNTIEYALECRPPQGSCLQQVLFTHFSIFKLYKERPS